MEDYDFFIYSDRNVLRERSNTTEEYRVRKLLTLRDVRPAIRGEFAGTQVQYLKMYYYNIKSRPGSACIVCTYRVCCIQRALEIRIFDKFVLCFNIMLSFGVF